MNVILAIPFQQRLILLFAIGAALGSLVNLVVDRLRRETPRYSPWNRLLERLLGECPTEAKAANTARKTAEKKARRRKERHGKAPAPRRAGRFALLPILGWFEVAATAPQDRPRGFWVRPCLVELCLAAGLALLYWWEVREWAMIPPLLDEQPIRALPENLNFVLHAQFAGHACLLVLMLAASLIDLAEWEIPDAIAVTGTLVGLAFAVGAPASRLFSFAGVLNGQLVLGHLQLASPGDPSSSMAPREPLALLLALGCVWLWCFGQLPRMWVLRRGCGVAARLFWRVLVREYDLTLRALAIGAVLTALCCLVWWYGDARWTSLLSALVGLTVGSGIVWGIRIIASAVLRQEAMGFGDVTLMAMIGAFLGWQAILVAFFLSPFFGLIPPIIGLLLRRKTQWELPFGPFLCLGAAGVLFWWASIWPVLAERLRMLDGLGVRFFLAVLGGAIVVLVALLFGVRALRRAFA